MIYTLDKECAALAQEIFEEDYVTDLDDAIHEWVDGHEWVIYPHHARAIVDFHDTSQGESFAADTGAIEAATKTYEGDSLGVLNAIASAIVYGEMVARVREHLDEMESDQ